MEREKERERERERERMGVRMGGRADLAAVNGRGFLSTKLQANKRL